MLVSVPLFGAHNNKCNRSSFRQYHSAIRLLHNTLVRSYREKRIRCEIRHQGQVRKSVENGSALYRRTNTVKGEIECRKEGKNVAGCVNRNESISRFHPVIKTSKRNILITIHPMRHITLALTF